MLHFTVDKETCISCGQCASDCPAMIISMETNLPTIDKDLERFCIGCLHCVAICSEGSVSILGYGPQQGVEMNKGEGLPQPRELEMLIKGRRSVRNYQQENIDPALIDKLLEVTSHAPSGHNDRLLHFSLVDDKGVMHDLREEAYEGIAQCVEADPDSEDMKLFGDILHAWQGSGADILFRGTPHMLVVSAHKDSAAPMQDAIIALTTFEMYAGSCGLGTVWNGFATLVISDIVPALQKCLGIPEDHEIGYVMGFGRPAIRYKRTIQRPEPNVTRVK